MLKAANLHRARLGLLLAGAASILALTGCGHSDRANQAASADNVEMPAEEALSGLDSSAVPQADPSATATDQPQGADASAAAADSAAQAVTGPAPDGPAMPSSAAASPAPPIKM